MLVLVLVPVLENNLFNMFAVTYSTRLAAKHPDIYIPARRLNKIFNIPVIIASSTSNSNVFQKIGDADVTGPSEAAETEAAESDQSAAS